MQQQQAKPSVSMTGNPIKVTVKAAIDRSTRKVTFADEWEAAWKNGPQKGPITVPKGTPATDINFHLDDETGLHLKFYRSFADAMYVGTGTECPPPRGNQGGQITFLSSSANLLKVRNANSGQPCDLKYALRFDGRDNTPGGESPPYVYDPDLKNGGGGVGGISTAALLIGVAALAVLGYVAYLAFA